VANSNRRNNIVDAIVVNGSLSSESVEIKEHIVQFYSQLSKEQFSCWRPNLDGLSFNFNGADESSCLERELRRVRYMKW
jgi:hypothetical protein